MNIFIDFDDTICPHGDVSNDPFDNAVSVIKKLRDKGNSIVIFSCRASKEVMGNYTEEATQKMIDYLHKWDIPYHGIYHGKPLFDVVIDDRAIGFHDNWDKIGTMLAGN